MGLLELLERQFQAATGAAPDEPRAAPGQALGRPRCPGRPASRPDRPPGRPDRFSRPLRQALQAPLADRQAPQAAPTAPKAARARFPASRTGFQAAQTGHQAGQRGAHAGPQQMQTRFRNVRLTFPTTKHWRRTTAYSHVRASSMNNRRDDRSGDQSFDKMGTKL